MKRFSSLLRREEISSFDLYTDFGTKSPLLAIYYNVACVNWEQTQKLIRGFPPDRQTAYLAQYLWRANLVKRNAEGYKFTEDDRRIAALLPEKLDAIRNFHSHIWHDNSVLQADGDLKAFVEKKHEEAKARLFEQNPQSLLDYEAYAKGKSKYALFKYVKDKRADYFTIEGRIFYLSFFLTAGQMNQLLQQCSGFKRADMPLFKIKRQLYTYYCHRDGATLLDFNHDQEVLASMPPVEKQAIIRARTAFKLVNYLYDYPEYWGSADWMPLYDEAGERINSGEALKQWLDKNPDTLPGISFSFIPIKKSPADADKKEHESRVRSGTLAFTVEGIEKYEFHITFPALHRLVVLQRLYQLKKEGVSPLELLKKNLQQQVDNRASLYAILSKRERLRTEDEWEYLTDRSHQQLRGGRKLTELSITFFENLTKGGAENPVVTTRLLNLIRPAESTPLPTPLNKLGKTRFTDDTEPDAIQVYEQDYIMGATQKFRAGNRFMYYSAKYLMDFGGQDWRWGMEKFAMDKKKNSDTKESLLKIKEYLTPREILESNDHRLTLEEDHVYLAIPRPAPKGSANHQQYYQFAIGPRAMRYLMAWVFEKRDKSPEEISSFLMELSQDLELLYQEGAWNSELPVKWLEPAFVMGYLKEYETGGLDTVRQRIQSRISHITKVWDHAVEHTQLLSRSEKNRLIMEAYRFYEWPAGGNGVPRFLRADEYNQMSVCHYSLGLKKKQQTVFVHKGRNYNNKYDYVYKGLFELDKRKPPIPKDVERQLQTAENLDELLVNVITSIRDLLNDKIKSILGAPPAIQKKELPGLCRRLGISIPASLLKGPETESMRQKHLTTLQVQPLAIHPMLMVKKLFPGFYSPAQTDSQSGSTDKTLKRPNLPVFDKLRKNASYRKRLHPDFYNKEFASHLFPEDGNKKQREKLIGEMDRTCAEDILLWQMAHHYLRDNHYTETLAQHLQQLEPGHQPLYDWLKLPIVIQLKPRNEGKDLYISILLHQLDDLLFRQERDRLRKLADHFTYRITQETALWEDDLKDMQLNQLSVGPLPDGSRQNPIPFGILMAEAELIRRCGQQLAERLLDWETGIFEQLLSVHADDKQSLHDWLSQHVDGVDYYRQFKYAFMNFDDVLAVAVSLGIEISEIDSKLMSSLRNCTFHNDIPESGSYSWITRSGERVRNILNMETDLHARKDRSAYEKKD